MAGGRLQRFGLLVGGECRINEDARPSSISGFVSGLTAILMPLLVRPLIAITSRHAVEVLSASLMHVRLLWGHPGAEVLSISIAKGRKFEPGFSARTRQLKRFYFCLHSAHLVCSKLMGNAGVARPSTVLCMSLLSEDPFQVAAGCADGSVFVCDLRRTEKTLLRSSDREHGGQPGALRRIISSSGAFACQWPPFPPPCSTHPLPVAPHLRVAAVWGLKHAPRTRVLLSACNDGAIRAISLDPPARDRDNAPRGSGTSFSAASDDGSAMALGQIVMQCADALNCISVSPSHVVLGGDDSGRLHVVSLV